MNKYGLIGKNIAYSFSQHYFEQKFKKLLLNDHQYTNIDIDAIEKTIPFLENDDFVGFNVTKPYKKQIIPYLDKLSDEAQEIGAVNTIKKENNQLVGYNTDAYGFEQYLKLGKTETQNKALVLGDGGAADAIRFVLKKWNIPHLTVSRKGNLSFENLTQEIVRQHPIVIQCTPVGTFPNVEESVPFPFEGFTSNHLAIDLIYNPSCTKWMSNAKKYGAKTWNGLLMLEEQAEKSWKIWSSQQF